MVHLHLTFPQTKEKVIAVCDISPGSASVAILLSDSTKASKVLASGHSQLALDERTSKQEAVLIGQQIREAAQAAVTAYHDGGFSTEVSEVYVIVHAPWMKSSTVEAGVVYGNEEYIHDSLIGKLAKEALSNATDLDMQSLLEASVVRVELNGYPTAQPSEKHARRVRVVSLIGLCDQSIKNAAQSAVQEAFPVAAVSWRSGIRALMTTARENPIIGGHYLIIDMGVNSTHIISVRDGSFEQRVVQEGVRTILARIAAGKAPEATLSALRMLSTDMCSTDECAALQKKVAESEPSMIKQFADSIGQLATGQRVANTLLLITHPDLESWLSKFFSRIDFSQFTITTAPFTVWTPATMNLDTWITGDLQNESLKVGAALVNIESRA